MPCYVAGVTTVYVDIDYFKSINDVLGHHAGDHLLARMSERLRAATRDHIARIGRDEFVVICGGDYNSAQALASRIRHEINSTPFRLRGLDVPVTASVGFSHQVTLDKDLIALLSGADAAMYRAKASRPHHPPLAVGDSGGPAAEPAM